MVYLGYKKNQFYVQFDWDIFNKDQELLIYVKDIFKKINLYYNEYSHTYSISLKRIEEVLLWFKYFGIEYMVYDSAIDKIKELKENFLNPESKILKRALFDDSILNPGITPFEFQKEGIDFILRRNKVYIADDAGLGKSFQTICPMSQLYKEGKLEYIFIVVRKGLQYHWEHEILDFVNTFKESDIVIIGNENKIKFFDSEESKRKKIFIIPNHIFAHIIGSYRSEYKGGKTKMSAWRWNKPYLNIFEKLNSNKIGLIIDEAHEFKNPYAVKTRCTFSLKEYFSYIYLISATPAINHFEDWWSPFYLLDKSIIPMSYEAFKIYISERIGESEFGLYKINEYNGEVINEVRKSFEPFILKRVKQDVPEMKVKKIESPIYLRMSMLQYKIYQSIIEEEIFKLTNEYNILSLRLILNSSPYMVQALDNPCLLKGKVEGNVKKYLDRWEFNKDPKVEWLDGELEEVIENLNEKVIIFDFHPKTLDMLEERYEKYNPLKIHGQSKSNDKQREDMKALFNHRRGKHKLFLIQTGIGGPGWNLQKGSRRIIFYSLTFDALLTKQASERTDRIISEKDSIIKYPLFDKTLEIFRYKVNMGRIELNDRILDKDLGSNELKALIEGRF